MLLPDSQALLSSMPLLPPFQICSALPPIASTATLKVCFWPRLLTLPLSFKVVGEEALGVRMKSVASAVKEMSFSSRT